MSYELLVGLQVTDSNKYLQYRQEMMPLLEKYGGGFRYDFLIKETLKSETENEINRVFVIYFKDKESMGLFFNDTEYLQIKHELYVDSVTATTILSEYEC
jgi:uncharacterized protein (DUF1330 family)